jgi:hypothetical protein
LLALGAGNDIKLHFLPFLQGFETTHLDSAEVRKQILAAFFRGNKPETFSVVKPLDSTLGQSLKPSVTNYKLDTHLKIGASDTISEHKALDLMNHQEQTRGSDNNPNYD